MFGFVWFCLLRFSMTILYSYCHRYNRNGLCKEKIELLADVIDGHLNRGILFISWQHLTMHGKSSVTLKIFSISSLVTTTNKHMAERTKLKCDEFMTDDDIQRLNEQSGNYGSAKIVCDVGSATQQTRLFFRFWNQRIPF